MNRIVVLLCVLLLAGCQAAPKASQPAAGEHLPVSGELTQVVVTPGGTETAKEVPPAPLENVPSLPEKGLNLARACSSLLAPEEVSGVCGSQGKIVLTPKMSASGCWVNIADAAGRRLTGGFTVVKWSGAEEAGSEFDRGVKTRKTQGAAESRVVGERSYEFIEAGRHNVVWVRDSFVTKLGTMDELCAREKLIELAKKIDERLQG